MRFLTSRFTARNFKALAIALSPLLAATLGILITIKSPDTQIVSAQTTQVDPACVARGLTDYMNRIIDARKADPASFSHIKLLSPAFNITNDTEAQIFDLMTTQSGVTANFEDLDGFAGNTYSHVSGAENVPAFDWYRGSSLVREINNRTWMRDRFVFQNAAKNDHHVYFTEYGDFDFNYANDRPNNIALAATQHNLAWQNRYIAVANYFNALGGNPEFAARHQLSAGEYRQITGSNSSRAGVNSAMPVNIGFPEQIVSTYGDGSAGYAVQISYSRGDGDLVEEYVRQSYQRGIKPILRICAGNTCDFAVAEDYINFLKNMNDDLVGDLYVLAGPNEPATELWATPECIRKRPLNIYDVECSAINPNDEPDFHSLRPFPANPCVKPSSVAAMCANDFIIQETIEVTPSQGTCTANPDGGQHCDFTIQSNVNASIDLSQAQLPIEVF